MADDRATTPDSSTASSHLSLVVRSDEGADERRILDVTRISTGPADLAAAGRAAAAGERLRLDDHEYPVFDLRAPPSGSDSERTDGCLVLGQRGVLRVALIVD